MITCAEVRKKLSEDLQLQEDEPLCARVRSHLTACTECRAFKDSIGETIGCFKAYDMPTPQDLHTLVLQRLRDEGLTIE